MPNNSDLDPQDSSHAGAHQTSDERPYDGFGCGDDLADYNQNEANDYCDE